MNEKIDFVIPWVDPNDPQWQKDKSKYSKIYSGENSNKLFNDLETLKFVFRSIEANCPWYNKIFLITYGHIPNWLNKYHPNIVIVKHEELYFNKEDLPTFNSQSIEMNLSNLKGLSEQFIYMNDDFIIMNKLNRSRFFVDSKPVDFLSHGWIKRGKLFQAIKGQDVWVNSLNNCLKLINRKFSINQLANKTLYHSSYTLSEKLSNFLLKNIYKHFIWLEHWHHPQPYLLSSIQQVHDEFTEEMSICSRNKFRSNNDLLQYIYRYWHLASNNFYAHKHNDGYVLMIQDREALYEGLIHIKKSNHLNFVCFNDQLKDSTFDHEFDLIKNVLITYLESKFSKKSNFEK